MVALARALMIGTRAILLDEPFQGLAPALALRYAEALRRLRDALPDVAILITESNPGLLRPLVDSTYVIERGEIGGLLYLLTSPLSPQHFAKLAEKKKMGSGECLPRPSAPPDVRARCGPPLPAPANPPSVPP
jgi:ABC-type Mn2+/Zn2+ transport system ATPase subunit